jgi:hypothetical protein
LPITKDSNSGLPRVSEAHRTPSLRFVTVTGFVAASLRIACHNAHRKPAPYGRDFVQFPGIQFVMSTGSSAPLPGPHLRVSAISIWGQGGGIEEAVERGDVGLGFRLLRGRGGRLGHRRQVRQLLDRGRASGCVAAVGGPPGRLGGIGQCGRGEPYRLAVPARQQREQIMLVPARRRGRA